MPDRPCVDIAMRSIELALAYSIIWSAGDCGPVVIELEVFIPFALIGFAILLR